MCSQLFSTNRLVQLLFVKCFQVALVEPMDDLVSMFGREPMLTMDHFWAGGPEYHQQEYDAAIQHRVMPVDVDELW